MQGKTNTSKNKISKIKIIKICLYFIIFLFLLFILIVKIKNILLISQNKNTQEVKKETKIIKNNFNKNYVIENNKANLLFVGDIMLSRGVEFVSAKYKNFSNYPLQNIATFTKSYDLTIGNLETPITSTGPYNIPYSLVFNSNPKYLITLKEVGFDILSLANNHAMDKQEKGLIETIDFLNSQNIDSIGAGKNCHEGLIKEINNIKIGLLAYSYTGLNHGLNFPHPFICNWNDLQQIKKDIDLLKEKTDFIILFTHSGLEFKNNPEKENELKMKQLIDWGVNAIINAHPHVIQKIEKYKDGIIAYSLGNFVFDDQEYKGTDTGLAIEINLEKNVNDKKISKNIKFKEHKIKIKNYCCPEIIN